MLGPVATASFGFDPDNDSFVLLSQSGCVCSKSDTLQVQVDIAPPPAGMQYVTVASNSNGNAAVDQYGTAGPYIAVHALPDGTPVYFGVAVFLAAVP